MLLTSCRFRIAAIIPTDTTTATITTTTTTTTTTTITTTTTTTNNNNNNNNNNFGAESFVFQFAIQQFKGQNIYRIIIVSLVFVWV